MDEHVARLCAVSQILRDRSAALSRESYALFDRNAATLARVLAVRTPAVSVLLREKLRATRDSTPQ
jgi:hypothetical protein